MGGGRSLLQARGGYRDKESEREKRRRIKERAGIYDPVEFKVSFLLYCCLVMTPDLGSSPH